MRNAPRCCLFVVLLRLRLDLAFWLHWLRLPLNIYTYIHMCECVCFWLAVRWRGQLLVAALFGGSLKSLLLLLLLFLREISRSLIQFAAFVAARHVQHTLPVTRVSVCMCVGDWGGATKLCQLHATRLLCRALGTCICCCGCWWAACGSNTAFARIYADFNVNFSCAACYDLPFAAGFECFLAFICLSMPVCALPLAVVGGTHVCVSIKIAFAGAFNWIYRLNTPNDY